MIKVRKYSSLILKTSNIAKLIFVFSKYPIIKKNAAKPNTSKKTFKKVMNI